MPDGMPAPGVPAHVAIIMDGNGRWAQQRRRPRMIGHRAGARAVNRTIDFCLERGIAALTLFAFSSENWGRPAEEVDALMKLFLGALDREVDELDRRGVRVRFIGDRARFAPGIVQRMARAEQAYTSMRSNSALMSKNSSSVSTRSSGLLVTSSVPRSLSRD